MNGGIIALIIIVGLFLILAGSGGDSEMPY